MLAHPASVDSIPTGGNKEDVVPMAMAAAWKLRRVIRNVRCSGDRADVRVTGPRLPRAAQARSRSGRAHAVVRRHVRPLEDDRVLSVDIERIAAAILDHEFTPGVLAQ